MTTTTSRRKPPIHCTPCRVTYEGQRYHIKSDGSVYGMHYDHEGTGILVDDHEPLRPEFAQRIRREASRQRRNRNARERNQAMRDLGMTKTPYGWE